MMTAMMEKKKINEGDVEKILKEICQSPSFRKNLTFADHYWFFSVYFSDYITYPIEWFHHEWFELTQELPEKLIAIMAAREMGKSTIVSVSYALWSVIGQQQKKLVVIISQTKAQARTHFDNICRQLEGNQQLINDFGPFQIGRDDHGSNFIELPRQKARIMIAASTQKIRGLSYGPIRPDLIICDDLEDSTSIMHKAEREKLWQWFVSDVLPLGNINTNIIVLGNLLHRDSFMMKLKTVIDEKKYRGIFRAYPLLDDNGAIVWPGKFPDAASLEEFKRTIIDDGVWQREYLLDWDEKLSAPGTEIDPAGLWPTIICRKRREAEKVTEKPTKEYKIHCLSPGEEYQITAPHIIGDIHRIIINRYDGEE
jgi:hypothetical protein